MFSTKMSHIKSSIEKKKNHQHHYSKLNILLQDHLTKSSTHKRIKLEKMISERVTPNTRRRPPSSCPIKLSTMNTTLKLGLLILCICPLLLLSNGSATNDHHIEEGSHLHPSDLIQQDHHHHRQHHSHLKRQAANSDGTMITSSSLSSSSDELDHTSIDESPSGHHFEPLMSALDHSQVEASTASSGGRSGRGNRVLYACEQKQLDIECQLGESIQLIRANYGRFSIQICNEHGQLNWKVDCVSPESTKIIANSCQARQSCQLLASNDIFGDSCPGTQKYLEVHYQCIPSNRTLSSPAASVEPSVQRASKNVIQDTTSASERARQRPSPPTAPLPPAQIPGWMLGLVAPPPPPALSGPGTPGTPMRPARPASVANQPGCPEMWWRHVRWPASEPGQLARVSCPAPNGATLSLTCLAGGQWAAHVQASHCQSAWLRNLTQRTELGDSTLSILAELAQLTRLTSGPVPDPARPATSNLFGDDLVQIARLIRRLVEEMGDLLSRIGDDKQRVSFAREMVQLLIEVANNLADERQQEAWTDLAQLGRAPSERQRTSGQLVSSLESALVLFAGALNQQQPLNVPLDGQAASDGQDDELLTSYLKVSENVFVTIRSLPAASNLNQSVELSLPSRPSTLGTKWWASEQQFTLHLQLGAPTGAVAESIMAAEPGLPQALRVVFVMIKGLGNHMEPASSPATSVNEHKQHLFVNSDLVSLSLVGAPPDQAHKSVKVDLSAPIELLFRHLDNNHDQWDSQPTWPTNRQQATRPPRCVYWDTTISDWLADGCKLVTSNRTHSLCACNHLTTFALLADWEPNADSLSTTTTTTTSATSTAAVAAQHPYQSATSSIETTTTTSGHQQQQQQQQQPPARVQLDNIENELLLSPTSSSVDRLYLDKLLDGNLFASNQRPLIYATCLVCALLLAVQLAAGAHCRAQARRLLGSMPAEPPPPLLVANQSHQAATRRSATTTTTTTTSQLSSSVDQSPTYSTSNDDYSSALAITKNKLMSTINGDYDFAQQATGTSRKPRQQARESLVVPMKLVGQLLFLQLLVLLLVESQNYLARNLPLRQLLSLQVSNFYGEPALVDTKAQEQLNPIGWLTYLVVFGLYYLISTLTCWLLGQLLKLNGCLGRQQRKLSGHSNVVGPADKQTYLAAAAHQGPLINNYQQQHHSSTSPTSSSSYQSSSSAGQGEQASSALYQHHHHHLQTKQVMLPAQLASRGASTSASQLDGDLWLTRMCLSQQVQWTLTNLAPLLISAAMLYLSCCWPDSLSQQINLQTYTSSFGSQLAFWPLLVDSSWTLPMGLLLFLLPSVGVALAVCALRKLRLVWSVLAQGQHRQPAHLLGAAEGTTNSNSNMNINGHLEGQQANNPYGISGLRGTQMVAASSLNKQSMVDEGGPNWAGQPTEAQRSPADTTEIGPKQAKLVCLVLMALLACHSIAWISFFAHCRQALRGQVSSSGQVSPSGPSGPSQQHLMWTFAASNLLVALLLAWCSRRTLKRAASLSGLGRLAACLRATGATSGAGPAKRHYSKRDGQPVQHYGQANIKVSPSSQSLFLISSSRPQTARHAHYGGAAGYHYGANSGAAAAEASQQHLYQQLAASQHIYDSANNLNVDLQQLNAMHLAGSANNNNNRTYQMQQYDQQQQQQQAAYTLNRSLGSQLHLSAVQQQQQFGAHPGDLNAQHRHLTLGPKFVHTNSNGNGNTNPNGNLNHFQQSGEADGPLVALAGGQQMMMASKPAATFGPHSMMGPASHLAAHRPQQVVTEHQLFNMNAGQQQQQQQMSSSSSSFHVASQSASSLDPSQYFNANGQPLRAAQAATNFRRANSKQHRQQQQQPPMIDKIQFKLNANQTMLDDSMANHQTNPNNIYDVANYNLQ